MKISLLSFNPIKHLKKQSSSIARFQNIPLQNDVFIKNAVVFNGASSTASFKVKDIINLHCPVCGYIMLNKNQQDTFVDDVYNKKGEILAKTLEKYEDESIFTNKPSIPQKSIFNPQRQQIVNIIKDLALKNPDLELSQLVELQAVSSIASLIERQLITTKELKAFIEQNIDNQERLQALRGIIQKHEKRIKGESPVNFSRKVFIYEFLKAVEEDKNKDKIHEIISKLPNSINDADSFFVKYSKDRTSREIALKLVEQSRPTAEHLVAESKGGASKPSNYICDCASCNQKKDDKDFFDWQQDIPNFQERLQDYLQTIQESLDKGEIPDNYETYITDVIETIFRISKGRIRLHKPDSTFDSETLIKIKNRNALLAKHQKTLNEMFRKGNLYDNMIQNAKNSPLFEQITSGKKTPKELKEENERQITELKSLIAQYFALEREKDKIMATGHIQDDIERLKAEITRLSDRNKKLEELNLASMDNLADYENYLHLKQLYDNTLKQIEEAHSISDPKLRKTTIEILNYALDGIKNKLAKQATSEIIEYFTNIEKSAIKKEKIKELRTKLRKARKLNNRIQEQQKTLSKKLQGRTIYDIQKACSLLSEDKRILKNIEKLPALEEKYRTIMHSARHNAEIMKQAKAVYKTASDEEFASIILQFNL